MNGMLFYCFMQCNSVSFRVFKFCYSKTVFFVNSFAIFLVTSVGE